MYLFNRRGRLDGGNTNEALAWATGITAKAKEVSDLEVGLWMQTYSPGYGTLVWSTFLTDLASLEAGGDKLAADPGYVAMADEGSKYISGGLDDGLIQIIHGNPDPNRTIEYAAGVQAVCATGNIANAMAVGVEIAQKAEVITGLPTLFGSSLTGPYGGVGWITGYANIGELEAAQQALGADASWVDMIDKKAAGVYAEEPSLTTQLIYRRIV
jgi:hypothetical protein